MAELLFPVYEMRPLPELLRGTVLRYADGKWIPDDGEFDLAFSATGAFAPMAYYVELPYERNILWSWRGGDARRHPGRNPWHYALRRGAKAWGGDWDRDEHPNVIAAESAMSKTCDLAGCANGRPANLHADDKHLMAGLIRIRHTGRAVKVPTRVKCMYCGKSPKRPS